MLTAILLGFALGLRHAADPDHLAAIAALVARHRRAAAAAAIGAAWGVGHSAAILAAGGVLVALHIVVAPAWTLAAEALVAAILIALGISNLRALRRGPEAASAAAPLPTRPAALRALGIGVAHGLGGSAALALLALAAMPSTAAAVAYLAVFGAGTVGGMVLCSLGLAIPLGAAGRSPSLARWTLAGSGALSVGVGIYLAFALGSSARLL